MPGTDAEYDLIIVGSGFGGAFAAVDAVRAGRRVLMIERGDWVTRSAANWGPSGFCELTDAYSRDPALLSAGSQEPALLGSLACVGGASVFFGGVALRFRERDFEFDPLIADDPGARWPYAYADLEPFYARAEQMLGVSGATGDDPTEPPRSQPFPQRPAPLAPVSGRVADAARALGLAPARLPLAINYTASATRVACRLCNTCDGFACAISAKNDLATTLIPELVASGLELAVNTLVTRILIADGRAVGVTCVDRLTRVPREVRARAVVVAAGALATPPILLASGLADRNPAGSLIGRHLMRHCNAVVMGAFLRRPAPNREFHKQLVIHDYYFGHPTVAEPPGKLGSIQQWGTPQVDYVVRYLSGWKRLTAPRGIPHTTGFIVIAEDQPSTDNCVALDARRTNRFGLPEVVIQHRYSTRDLTARGALAGAASRILRRAGALATFTHDIVTFSHAAGTVRMGTEAARSPLDEWGGVRGVHGLWVTDASVFPRSAGVNPSLTIAANALRTGAQIAQVL
jgi:choline dehydrogenase-like flavoprotein